MARQVNIGGDRLGSGNKMKVDLHGFERSNHNLDYIWRSTMAAGTLVPFLSKVILPGDTFDIDLDCNVMTHPTLGPLFGSFKVQLDLFQIPIRLYVGVLHMNRTKIGLNMGNIKLPQLQGHAQWEPTALDLDNSQVNPSCILKYLGIGGWGTTPNRLAGLVTRRFNAVPLVGYYNIYKQYYANKQEENGYIIHYAPVTIVQSLTAVRTTEGGTPTVIPAYGAGSAQAPVRRSTKLELVFTGTVPIPSQIFLQTNKGEVLASTIWGVWTNAGGILTGTDVLVNTSDEQRYEIFSWRYMTNTDPQDREPQLLAFPLTNIDTILETLQSTMGMGTPAILDNGTIAPVGSIMQGGAQGYSKLGSQEGLAIKTYQSDKFNNWVNDEWIDGVGGVNDIASVSTASGKFTVEALVLANKVYNLFNRIAITDGTYQAYINAAYDHDLYGLAQHPVYEGGLSKELEFQEVVSNAAATGEDQPLGTLAGKGVMGRKHKGGSATIKANEIGYVMGIVSLTPRIDYSQGNEWDVNLTSIGDFHVPNLDGIGFQDLNAEELHWSETRMNAYTPTYKAVGKQPAWINYMTSVNKVYGNFAIKGQEMFMTLNRNYSVISTGIKDLTTYIDPVKYNQIFAYTSRDAQNFWVQIRIGINARRKMSAKVMPNL